MLWICNPNVNRYPYPNTSTVPSHGAGIRRMSEELLSLRMLLLGA